MAPPLLGAPYTCAGTQWASVCLPPGSVIGMFCRHQI